MEINRLGGVERLNVQFKEMQSSKKTQRSFAEIILIDRTCPNKTQLCYILKNDRVFSDHEVENFKQGHYSINKDDFLLVGEAISIDKHQKYVLLKDENSLSYNHLILASGSQHELTYEFIDGVHALVDAIRVRKKIPSSFPQPPKASSSKRKMKSSKTHVNDLNFPKKIDGVKSRKINNKLKSQDSSSLLSNPNKRLYEVQL